MDMLITYAYMRDQVSISQNIEDLDLKDPIVWAQENLRGILGESFYAALIATPTAYPSLLDPYVKQYVAWKAKEFWLPSANTKSTRTGMRVYTEENSTAASPEEMASLIRLANQRAGYYQGLLLNHLKINKGLYPLYNADSCNSTTGIGSPLHFTKIGRKPCR